MGLGTRNRHSTGQSGKNAGSHQHVRCLPGLGYRQASTVDMGEYGARKNGWNCESKDGFRFPKNLDESSPPRRDERDTI